MYILRYSLQHNSVANAVERTNNGEKSETIKEYK